MGGDGHRLNASDRFMLVIDRAVRALGGPGFDTLTFLLLDGRADRDRLRRGLAALNAAHPVVTARLVLHGPAWVMCPGADLPLREADLPTADRQGVLDFAAGQLTAETDPTCVDPMRFHLLHLPDGRDVFLAQYSHVLLDHSRAVAALRRIDDPAAPVAPAPGRWRDPVRGHLRQFPPAVRRRAAQAVRDFRAEQRGGAVRLGAAGPPGPRSYAILQRVLSAEETRAVEARARAVTGVPNLSMALLASAFRGVDRLAPDGPGRGAFCQAGIALDLGLRAGAADRLENLATLVPVRVPCAEVGGRDDFLRLLAGRFRARLSARTDVGMLKVISGLGRQRSRAAWVMDALMRYCLCFWYGYLGTPAVGPAFAGAGVLDVFSAGPTWPSVGVTLLANQSAGRLHFQLTHIPESVPASLAAAFLDFVAADLLCADAAGI